MWAFRPLLCYSSIFLSPGTQLFAFSANISLFSGAFYFIFWRSIAQCKKWKQQPAFIFHVCLDEPVNCEDCCLPALWHHVVMEVYWHFRGLCHSRILQNVSAHYETTLVSHTRSDCCENLKCWIFLVCWYMLVFFLAERYKGGCQGFCPFFFFFTFYHFLVPSVVLLLEVLLYCGI